MLNSSGAFQTLESEVMYYGKFIGARCHSVPSPSFSPRR